MPALNIKLIRSIISFSGKEKSDEWSLVLIGKCKRGFHTTSFTIFGENGSWNGFGADVRVIVHQRPPRAEAEGISALAPFVNHTDSRDCVLVECPNEYRERVSFEVTIWLPQDAFQRFTAIDWTKQAASLYVRTPTNLQGREWAFTYGNDPDGREIEWHTKVRNWEYLEDVTLSFSPARSQIVSQKKQKVKKAADVEHAQDPIEQMLAAVQSVTVSIIELRGSLVKAAWVIAVVLVIGTLLR